MSKVFQEDGCSLDDMCGNRFDIEKFLDHQLKLRAKDEFEVIDADE